MPMPTIQAVIRRCALLALVWCWAQGAARAQTQPEAAVWTDPQTGLTWSRCLEGMRWDGRRCLGWPRRVSHAQAAAMVRERAGWRLPRLPELQRLAKHAALQGASGQLDLPAGWLWTATAHVDATPVNPYNYGNVQRGVTPDNGVQLKFLHGWALHWPDGRADGERLKREPLGVLLVRAEP
ncbi:MAG: DUF1566 domain-containing protein [Inhella sp.]|nr:DUF1566 domain-containing protein [Inhella sp.]MCZ8234957.1 DUF1566 domain-containing protein [Inhella sp.]